MIPATALALAKAIEAKMPKAPTKSKLPKRSPGRTIKLDKNNRPYAPDKTPRAVKAAKMRRLKSTRKETTP